jgi:hypothetical protein
MLYQLSYASMVYIFSNREEGYVIECLARLETSLPAINQLIKNNTACRAQIALQAVS